MTDKVRIPQIGADKNDLVNGLLKRLDAKAPRNILRKEYYDAHRFMRHVVTGAVPPQYYNLGLVLGWTAKGVDLLQRRSTLEGFEWPDGDLESLGARQLWDDNMLRSEVNQALTSSLIHATAFVVTTRGDESAGEPPALIHFKDALSATGEYDTRTRRLKNLLSVQGRDGEGRVTAFALYLDGETVSAYRESGSGAWHVDVSTHPWGVPAEPLVYRPRLGRPFGSSRITRSAMGLQDAATRELVRLEGHMDVYSFPEFWMLGADASIFTNEDGSPTSPFKVMLGRIKGIPDDEDAVNPRADVKQFQAASPEPHLASLNAYAKSFARELSLPDTSVAITDFANPTSGESYDASQYELIAEAEGAMDDWSPALRRSFVRALAIQNGETEIPASWRSIDTDWRDPRYTSRAAKADAGLKIIQARPELAQTSVGLEVLGLDRSQRERVEQELARGAARARLDALLGQRDGVSAAGGE